MSLGKLTKFPVTAPDGTEFLVKITEHGGKGAYDSDYAKVRLYLPREKAGRFTWRKFRRVYTAAHHEIVGHYCHSNPDYVRLARATLLWYFEDIALCPKTRRKLTGQERNRLEARKKLTEWDGRITQ